METYSLDPRCWQIFRVVSRNPLLRRCDRVEALITLLAIVVALFAPAVAGLAGSMVYTARDRQYTQEAATRQVIDAIVVGVDPDGAVVTAEWHVPAGKRTGQIRTDGPAQAGQPIKIGVNSNGDPVPVATSDDRALIDAAVIGASILLGVPTAMAALLGLTRRRVGRARDAQWERDIRYLLSDTGRSSQQ